LLECFGRGDDRVGEVVMTAVMFELDNHALS
jgi:hypothetical protein